MLQFSLLLLLASMASNDASAANRGFLPLGPFGGDVRSLAVHPDKPERFFLGTSDGLVYVSGDAGESWRKLEPGLGRRDAVIDNLLFRPDDPDTLYAAFWELRNNRGWLYRTHDGGQSWEDVSPREFRSPIRAIAIAPSNPRAIALGISEGVLLSLDEGDSWQRITRGYRDLYNVESLAFDPTDFNTLYVGTWRLGWKTVNLGKKWQAIHQGMYFDSDMFSLLVNPREPSKLFASACTGIYRSLDAGGKWVKLTNGLPKDARRTRTLEFDPSDPQVVYAGTTAGLFVSHDGGDRWTRLIDELTINAIAVQPGRPERILVGTDDAGVLRSDDGGVTFAASNEGFIHRQISALAADPGQTGTLFAAISNDSAWGGFFQLSPTSQWRAFNDGLETDGQAIVSILPDPASRQVYLATPRKIWVGTPFETAWREIAEVGDSSIAELAFAGPEGRILLAATSRGLLRLDLESGKRGKVNIPVYDGRISGLFRDPESGTLFASGDIGVFQSKDQGATWKISVKGLPPIPVNFVRKAGGAFFAGTRDGLYRSLDGGASWRLCESVYPLDIIALSGNPLRPAEVLAADSASGFLFYSEDGGQTWTALPPDNRSRAAQLVHSGEGTLFAGTLSEGVYRISLGDGAQTGLSGR